MGDPSAGTPTAGSSDLRIRPAARALILDPADRVLLVRFEFPTAAVWATPGGGIEPGEDHETALRRELDEELGITDVDVGPHIWTRRHVIRFPSGLWDGQQEHVYLVRVHSFEPRPRLTWEQLRSEYVHELRWWTLDELRAVEPHERLRFAPGRLVSLVADVLRDGPPSSPIDTGV